MEDTRKTPIPASNGEVTDSSADQSAESAIEQNEGSNGAIKEQDNQEDSIDPVVVLQSENKKLHERLLRTAADLDNFRKRARRDIEEAKISSRSEVLRDILPIIDGLDLALGAANSSRSVESILEGVEMVRKQFSSATERFGLKPVESVGRNFDPSFHEAVAQMPSEQFEVGKIIEEIRKGYTLNDKLLRASLVVVSRGGHNE